ncbi:Aste57867_289 [Aphanomyces stellatus]|uniref:Poly [ADP-ribose] polymerase n=1 Tax=Aphanomyces stellatus TaxID=120398 RepID=A0A485K5B5_9STRA|nr:hypothetical protein As57867_000289 [Aphanomyces stellatus]VFT77515.1 Aste57867_289 [Aphanomyces stellatus]
MGESLAKRPLFLTLHSRFAMPPKKSTQVKRKKASAKAKPPAATNKPNASKASYGEDGVELLFEANSIVAVRCDGDDGERFWIAQLMDDTVVEMLDDAGATVNVVYLERSADTNVYTVGSYDALPVQAIMCEVHLDEVTPGEFKLPKRHVDRIESVLAKIEAGEEVPDEVLQPLKKRKTTATASIKANGGVTGGRTPKASKTASAKVDKVSGLPKCIAKEPITDVADDDLAGSHAFRAKCNDVVSSSKEVIRAVLTRDYKLLENLVKKPAFAKHIFSLHVRRSPGVPKTALHYAIERGDFKAINLLLPKKETDETKKKATKLQFAKKPVCALTSLDTGKHTSAFSDYNRRALNASRGGKEGNNALLKDVFSDEAVPSVEYYDEELGTLLFSSPTTTYELAMLMNPGDDWVRRSHVLVPQIAHCGNYKLAEKIIGILFARGGWGYNALHGQVLGSAPLEPFRKVSVIKKADYISIRPLHLAAINPNPAHLEALLAEIDSASLSELDNAGWQAVHFAAVCEGPGPLKVLVAAKADLVARTKAKDSVLTVASRVGRIDNVRLLLEHVDASAVEGASMGGLRPLHHAAKHGHADVVQLLLEHGANTNAGTSNKESPLALAAEAGHLECVQALLAHKTTIVDILNKVRRTPLMLAVMNGHVQVAVALLNAGANANAVDSSMNSVMHYAAGYGWLACVKLLHSIDAAAWVQNAWGYTPMAVAALKGRYDCSRFLIDRAPPNERAIDFRDANGATMLFLQCKLAENIDEIEFLLSKGANPNVGTLANEFPLQQVLLRLPNDDLEPTLVNMAKRLIKHKAHVSHADYCHMEQPVVLAMQKKNKAFLDLLLPETDLATLGPNGENIWMAAIMQEDPSYIQRLLASKHNLEIVADKDGDNLFHYLAQGTASVEVATKLINKVAKPELNSALLHVNNNGDTPLMALLRFERETKRDRDYEARDVSYSDIVALVLKHTPQVETMVCQGKIDPENDKQRLPSSETLLHVAANRRLKCSATGWRGFDLLQLVLGQGNWSASAINAVSDFKSALLLASERGHTAGATELVTRKADVNFVVANPDPKVESTTPLFAAISGGYVAIAAILLQHGAKASFAVGKAQKTPLHVALERNDAAAAKVLVEHGADVCAKNADGLSALSSAIRLGFSVTKAELHANEVVFGAKINELNGDAWDFLCLEVRRKEVKPANVPEPTSQADDEENEDKDEDDGSDDEDGGSDDEAGSEYDEDGSENDEGGSENDDDENDNGSTKDVQEMEPTETTPAAPTSADDGPSAISVLLQQPSVAPAIGLGDENGRTPLHYACAKRDAHLLRALLLLSQSAINAMDVHQRTPLHFAVNSAVMTPDATFDIESILVAHGADVNAADVFGFTPLHFAFQKLNLDWHFDASVQDKDKFEAYMATLPASESDPIETVGNLCLVPGLKVNCQDVLGRTCLHLGAATGAVVSTLSILHVASPGLMELMDRRGDTALGRAMAHGRKSLVTTLIQQGANIQTTFTKNKTRFSLYFYAVQQTWQGVCHMLLNAGYCRRQAVEDSIRNHGFQLTHNLITGLANSKDKILLQTNADGETLLHVLAQQVVDFDGLARTIAWQLVDAGVSVAAKTKAGVTALHFAAAHGSLQLMRFLLHLDASLLNAPTTAKETPLVFGIKRAGEAKAPQLKTVARTLVFFVREKANLVQPDSHGCTVLSLVLDTFANLPSADPLVLLDIFDHLLVAKVSPNGLIPTNLKVLCSPQSTATHLMRLTPLMRALYIPSTFLRQHTLALFLHHGAKVSEADEEGHTVLMHAVVCNHLDDVKLLLDYVNKATWKSGDKTKTIEFQVPAKDRQAVVKAVNVFGETALHLAVMPKRLGSFENVDMVSLLVNERVPLNVANKKKQTAIDLARLQPSGILVNLLLKETTKPVTPPAAIFPIPPAVEHDATVFLNQCQAQGLVKTVPTPAAVNPQCQAGNKPAVHVDDGGVEYSVVLTKVDVQSGQHGVNVFYRMQVVHNQVQDVFVLFTNWGRIGESGKYQHTPFNDSSSAVDEFKKIFKSKTSNVFGATPFQKKSGKYMLFHRRSDRHEYDAKVGAIFELEYPTKSKLSPALQQILRVVTDIRCLEEAARDQHHDLTDIPLVELQPSVLSTAIDALNEIKAMILANADVLIRMKATGILLEPSEIAGLADTWRAATEAIAEKCSRYFEVVPRSDASNQESLAAFMTQDAVNAEITRVRHLLDIAETSKIILGAKAHVLQQHPLDYCYAALQVQLEPSSTVEFDTIAAYFNAGVTTELTKYKVARVLKVNRKGEAARMASIVVPGHHTLLWHGTKKTNLMGILSRGLRIAPPEAPVTGYAFGKGVYFADASQKSLNYCGEPYELADKRKVHYMLVCDVALGTTHNVTDCEYREAAADGTHSTFAQAEHQPDPADTLVTTAGPCKVPLGRIKHLGVDLPLPSAWAIGNVPDFSKSGISSWQLQNNQLSADGQKLLEEAVATGKSKVELVHSNDVNLRPLHLFGEQWATVTKATVTVEDRQFHVTGQEYAVACSVKLEFEDGKPAYTYAALKRTDVLESTVLPDGFKWHMNKPFLNHNEYIVYNEAQARICYLVEIECVSK